MEQRHQREHASRSDTNRASQRGPPQLGRLTSSVHRSGKPCRQRQAVVAADSAALVVQPEPPTPAAREFAICSAVDSSDAAVTAANEAAASAFDAATFADDAAMAAVNWASLASNFAPARSHCELIPPMMLLMAEP